MKKLVIFDLDGTLLNTIEDLGQAANYALERNGYATHSMASYPYFVGNGVRRLMTRVLPEDARDDARHPERVDTERAGAHRGDGKDGKAVRQPRGRRCTAYARGK